MVYHGSARYCPSVGLWIKSVFRQPFLGSCWIWTWTTCQWQYWCVFDFHPYHCYLQSYPNGTLVLDVLVRFKVSMTVVTASVNVWYTEVWWGTGELIGNPKSPHAICSYWLVHHRSSVFPTNRRQTSAGLPIYPKQNSWLFGIDQRSQAERSCWQAGVHTTSEVCNSSRARWIIGEVKHQRRNQYPLGMQAIVYIKMSMAGVGLQFSLLLAKDDFAHFAVSKWTLRSPGGSAIIHLNILWITI